MSVFGNLGVSLGQVLGIIPQPGSTTPPGVADSGQTGSGSEYARWDHTHASKARKGTAAVQSNVGTYTWTYPTAFGAGVVPICNAIARTNAGVSDVVNVQIEGDPTNTQCVFRVSRFARSFLSLLGLDVLTFQSGAIPVTLHMLALEP